MLSTVLDVCRISVTPVRLLSSSDHCVNHWVAASMYTVNPVIYAVILFMRIMRIVVRAHK